MTAAERHVRRVAPTVRNEAAIEPSVSVADVAKAMAVSTDAVRREIRRGALAAEKVFGRVRIRESELERYRAEHRIVRNEQPAVQTAPRSSARRRPGRGSLAALRAIEEEASG
jgi:excisionase family DNA binding protein